MFAMVGVAILIGLGIWQLDRKAWKENLIATLTTRLARAPPDLPPRDRWAASAAGSATNSRASSFPAEFLDGQEALVYTAGSAFRPDVKGPGYWVFAPARLAGGSIVIVDRGFVPLDRKDPATPRARRAARQRRHRRRRALAGDARPVHAGRRCRRTMSGICAIIKAMAAAKKWASAAPFYIEQEAPVPPGGLPQPGKLQVNLPDNHLQYALTWFGLGAGARRRLSGLAARAPLAPAD